MIFCFSFLPKTPGTVSSSLGAGADIYPEGFSNKEIRPQEFPLEQ